MLGFDAIRAGLAGDDNARAFTRPIPLLAEGRVLAPLVTAMMDVSDGLLLDASRIAAASGVALALELTAIPLAAGVEAAGRSAEALRWGDDYQLLFTLPAGVEPPVPASRIGEVQPAGPFPILRKGLHFHLRTKDGFLSHSLGLGAEHDAAVTLDIPLHLTGHDEVAEVLFLGAQIGAGRIRCAGANDAAVLHHKGGFTAA